MSRNNSPQSNRVDSTECRILMPLQVSPPQKYSFTDPSAWPAWRKRFERYMSVSGQGFKTEREKIDILIYTLGEESENVILQFERTPATLAETLQEIEK